MPGRLHSPAVVKGWSFILDKSSGELVLSSPAGVESRFPNVLGDVDRCVAVLVEHRVPEGLARELVFDVTAKVSSPHW